MTTQNQNPDEIDLRDLFKFIGKGISNFFNYIINLFVLIRSVTLQHFKLFAGVTTLFLVAVMVYNFQFKKDVFGSSMVIESLYFNTQLMENSITKLDQLAKEQNKTTLANTLNIPLETAILIKGFEYEPFVTEEEKLEVEILKEKLSGLKLEEDIINSITSKIEVRNPNTFKITVYTEENSVMSALDSAMFTYFVTNEYIKKRITINRETLKKRKKKLEKEQLKMDSLKTTIFNVYESLSKKQEGQGSDNVILAGQEVSDPLSVFREDFTINNDILNIERTLFLKNEVEVIEGFTPFSKPVSASIIELLFYTVLSAIGVTYALIILVALNRFLANRETQLNP